MDFSASRRFSKMTMGFVILLYFILIIRDCNTEETNLCSSELICGKCIEKSPMCAWCSQEDFTERKIPRCDFYENLLQLKCTDVFNPENSRSDKKRVDVILSEKGTRLEDATQIRPQNETITLRPKSPETISMQFRQVVDYPVDLYYLIDVTNTMKTHETKIQKLGVTFANSIAKMSSNFTMGVGCFLDKAATSDVNLQIPKFKNSVFKHYVNLTAKLPDFQSGVVNSLNEIDTTVPSLNFMSPQGVLDAILQSMVCTKVKWRPDAKKLLVVATGNDFYHAGDRKLSGIVQPNDGQCHSDSDGYVQQDYPSVSQINRKIREHNITIIFAVTENLLDVYGNLSDRLVGSSTGILSNPSDILEIAKKEYQAISSSVEMCDNSAQIPGNVEISYNSTCLDGENKERSVCRNFKPEDTLNFTATLKFSSCPERREDWIQTIAIKPAGRTSQLTIVLNMTCDCDCKKPENAVERCSGAGTYECGVCRCNSSRYGRECECFGEENESHYDESECRRGRDEYLCSNRGECRCGKCFCNPSNNSEEVFYGKYCHCSNFSCPSVNNKICNGHGRCDCGICKCNEGWSGRDCTCGNTTENCVTDDNGVICSGHGTCHCGSCKCDETYEGRFCEDCTSCPGKCEEYSICVKCFLSHKDDEIPGAHCLEECEMKHFTVHLVDTVEANETLEERTCSVRDEDGCHIIFKYQKRDNQTTIIHAQRDRECPPPPDIVAIVLGTIGSIVLAGLVMLLIWKLLTYVHDRREFAKFEKERERAKWDTAQNPIFIPSTSNFENPGYRRSS